MSDVSGGGESLDFQTSDLELRWQSLLDILQCENMDVGPPTAFNRTSDSGTSGMFGGARTQTHQQHSLLETPRQHGSENQSGQSKFLLTPSAELEDHSSEVMRTTSVISDMDSLQPTANLFGDSLLGEFVLGLDGDNSFTTFDLSQLTQDLMDRTEADELPALTSTLTRDRTLLLCEEDADDLTSPLSEFLENSNILEDIRLLDLALDEGFVPEVMTRQKEEVQLHGDIIGADVRELRRTDSEDESDLDSGLSLDFRHSPASSVSGSSAQNSFTSTSSNSPCCVSSVDGLFSEDEREGSVDLDPDVVVTAMLEEKETAEGVGGWENVRNLSQISFGDELCHSCFWMEHIGHDHTYSQCLSSAGSQSKPKQTKSTLKHGRRKPYRRMSGTSQEERCTRTLKIPLSNELIVHLPVEVFNDLLSHHQLAAEQVALIRDIRRRGKNKIAAHNCRKRKQDVLLKLESEVSSLRHRHSLLLRERWEVMRHMREVKQRLGLLS